jgi:dihydrofolate synthase / folylpolyglutamate synthase
MNYRETLHWLFEKLPMYQRIGASAYKADLQNTITLLDLLDNPQHAFRSVHIAGTNGKGSVSHMIAAVLQESGFKTGLYTSPHLKDFRERIRINGQMISEEAVVTFVERHKQAFEQIGLSFFEMTVGMAFDYFRSEKVDVAVVETGMGGRLDSTNLLLPELSIITNIGYDHMQFLGNSLELIAAEKAGIIKKAVPVVIGETQEQTKAVFEQKAAEMGSPIVFADRHFDVSRLNRPGYEYQYFDVWKESSLFIENLPLPLLGHYQEKNLVTAVCALDQLQHTFPVNKNDLYEGLSRVSQMTGLSGRWQVLGRNPLVVADTAHNTEGIGWVIRQVMQQKFNKLHIVLGVVQDKNVDTMLQQLPRSAAYYFCKADIPRALDAVALSEIAFGIGLRGEVYNSVYAAFQSARNNAGFDDMIFVGGSTFVVAEVL